MNRISTRVRLSAFAAVFVLLASACGDDSGGDTVVAEVEGGGTLSESELIDALEEIGDGGNTVERAAAGEVITLWARNELFFTELEADGYTIADSFYDDARSELEAARAQGVGVPEPDTFEYGEAVRGTALSALVADFLLDQGVVPIWPVQLCSSHILLDTEAEALAAIDRYNQGEDFAALAMELSTGPSGPSGGDLGCVDPATFVPEFTEGAASVGDGEVTQPVESPFGFHVIFVESFGPTPSDDPIEIQNALFGTEESAAFQADALARSVTVDDRYGSWDDTSYVVVPG